MNRTFVCWALAGVSGTMAAGGCGTLVKNPGDGAEPPPEETRSEKPPRPVKSKPPSSGDADIDLKAPPTAPAMGHSAKPCELQGVEKERVKAVGEPITFTLTVAQGSDLLDVTPAFGFAVQAPEGALLAAPFTLPAVGRYFITVLKENMPVCETTLMVSADELAEGGAWTMRLKVQDP